MSLINMSKTVLGYKRIIVHYKARKEMKREYWQKNKEK